jgi:ArsR family transcriptional regulator
LQFFTRTELGVDLDTLADTFKALSDPSRLRILILLERRDRSVTEIVDFFSLTQPTISRHLQVLKDAELVKVTRDGQKMIYSLDRSVLKQTVDSYFESVSPTRRR